MQVPGGAQMSPALLLCVVGASDGTHVGGRETSSLDTYETCLKRVTKFAWGAHVYVGI